MFIILLFFDVFPDNQYFSFAAGSGMYSATEKLVYVDNSEDFLDAFINNNKNITVILKSDITVDDKMCDFPIIISGTKVLDMNGYNINITSEYPSSIFLLDKTDDNITYPCSMHIMNSSGSNQSSIEYRNNNLGKDECCLIELFDKSSSLLVYPFVELKISAESKGSSSVVRINKFKEMRLIGNTFTTDSIILTNEAEKGKGINLTCENSVSDSLIELSFCSIKSNSYCIDNNDIQSHCRFIIGESKFRSCENNVINVNSESNLCWSDILRTNQYTKFHAFNDNEIIPAETRINTDTVFNYIHINQLDSSGCIYHNTENSIMLLSTPEYHLMQCQFCGGTAGIQKHETVTMIPPDCNSNGLTDGILCKCGYITAQRINSLHSELDYHKTEPSCISYGTKYPIAFCNSCSKYIIKTEKDEYRELESEKDILMPLEQHSIIEITANFPTCTEDGNINHFKCKDCGKLFSDKAGLNIITDVSLSASHNYHWVISTPATEQTSGEKILICSDCAHIKEYEEIPPETVSFSRGDINDDGQVTSADARLALRYSVGLETFSLKQKCSADADNDNEITSSDARLILRFSVGLEYFL